MGVLPWHGYYHRFKAKTPTVFNSLSDSLD